MFVIVWNIIVYSFSPFSLFLKFPMRSDYHYFAKTSGRYTISSSLATGEGYYTTGQQLYTDTLKNMQFLLTRHVVFLSYD